MQEPNPLLILPCELVAILALALCDLGQYILTLLFNKYILQTAIITRTGGALAHPVLVMIACLIRYYTIYFSTVANAPPRYRNPAYWDSPYSVSRVAAEPAGMVIS